MTKPEAITAMKEGKKVSHKSFLEDEWIEMKGGEIYDEGGGKLTNFWKYRTVEDWNHSWAIIN